MRMADISKDELRKEITVILKDADLTTMSAKKVRQQIEEKLDIDLTERKKEVDDLVMEYLKEKQDGGKKKKTTEKKKAASEESEENDEEEEEGSEEEEEEEKKPAKRTPAKKVNKRKKESSEDEESASDEDASDEEYSPKKDKSSPKKSKPGKKTKKKGSDSDSDEDWAKKKSNSRTGKKGPGKGKGGSGGGYTKAVTLSPELAAFVGAEKMARHEVVKKIWCIIKERNLYDPKNKQFAICDDDLLKVIGVKRFRTFGMMKHLKNHFKESN